MCASRSAALGSSTKRSWIVRQRSAKRSRLPGASGLMSSSSRRFSRSESCDSALRRLPMSSTVRSYSGPKPSRSWLLRRLRAAVQIASRTSTTTAAAMTIQTQVSISSSSRVSRFGRGLPVWRGSNPVKVRLRGTRFETEAALGGRPAAQEEGARAAQGADAADHGPPVELAAYLDELVERARGLLGEDLVGVYLAGSAALGGYIHGRSDVDVAVAVRNPLARATKEELVAALRHEA